MEFHGRPGTPEQFAFVVERANGCAGSLLKVLQGKGFEPYWKEATEESTRRWLQQHLQCLLFLLESDTGHLYNSHDFFELISRLQELKNIFMTGSPKPKKKKKHEIENLPMTMEKYLQKLQAWEEKHVDVFKSTILGIMNEKDDLALQKEHFHKELKKVRDERDHLRASNADMKQKLHDFQEKLKKESEQRQDLEKAREEVKKLKTSDKELAGATSISKQEVRGESGPVKAREHEVPDHKEATSCLKEATTASVPAPSLQPGSKDKEIRKLQSHITELKAQLAEAMKAQKKLFEERKSLLESMQNTFQLGEEANRQLQQPSNTAVDIVRALRSLQQQQKEICQVVQDLGLRKPKQDEEEDESFMSQLPPDLKLACLHLQRLVGGQGRQFSELLLGEALAWSSEELRQGGWFLTTRKFWLLVQKWVEASKFAGSTLPLTLKHLTQVCQALKINIDDLKPLSLDKERVLESNFVFMLKHLDLVVTTIHLRGQGRLTEEARDFLNLPGTRNHWLDRLLAVVYSLGEDGFCLLLKALKGSSHPHVLYKLQQDISDAAGNDIESIDDTIPKTIDKDIKSVDDTVPKTIAKTPRKATSTTTPPPPGDASQSADLLSSFEALLRKELGNVEKRLSERMSSHLQSLDNAMTQAAENLSRKASKDSRDRSGKTGRREEGRQESSQHLQVELSALTRSITEHNTKVKAMDIAIRATVEVVDKKVDSLNGDVQHLSNQVNVANKTLTDMDKSLRSLSKKSFP